MSPRAGVSLAVSGLCAWVTTTAHAAVPEGAEASVAAFLSPETVPVVGAEVLTAVVDFQTQDRFLDLLIALGFIGVVHVLGLAIKRIWATELRPSVFTSTVLAIPMLFAVNMDFYDLHQVSVDAEGITTHHYMSSDEHVSWVDVRAVEVDEGALFPVVTDDRSLRFVDAEGAACSVPRYVPQAEAIAAGALGHLRAAALRTGAKEATP